MAECNFGFTAFLDALVLIGLMLLANVFPAWLYPCLFYLQVSCALHGEPTATQLYNYLFSVCDEVTSPSNTVIL